MSTDTLAAPHNPHNPHNAPRHAGNKATLPDDAMRRCPSCSQQRGSQRKGWTAIERGGQVVGFTCPDCPADAEPIRRELLADDRARFRATVVISANGQRQQRRRRFDSLTDARAWVTETRDGLRGQTAWVDTSAWSVAELCDAWLTHRRQEVETGGVRISTVNGYESGLRSLLGKIGSVPARKLTASNVEDGLRALAMVGGTRGKPLSHRSLTAALVALRMAYRHGQREEWVSSNPAAWAKVPASQRRLPDGATVLRWDAGELGRFRDELAGHDGWIQVGMMLSLTALRRSEVLAVDWANVDLDTGAVRVVASRTKTGRGNATTIGHTKSAASQRTVQVGTIHPGFVTALKTLWMQQGRPTTGLVIADANGPIRPDRFSRTFDRIAGEAGLRPLARIHNVRHSVATYLQAAGVSNVAAASLLGIDIDTYLRFYVLTDDAGADPATESVRGLYAVNAAN